MLKTSLGPKEDATSVAYLRPETAQAMFVDFAQVLASSRKRVPFGIAQMGKAFRNEITPGNFVFRTREFEIMEFEYFVHPSEWEKYFAHFLEQMHEWIAECGIDTAKSHELEVSAEDRAHYSSRTVDIEFDYPFGRKELYGLAYRSDFDLKNHSQHSGKELVYTDPNTNEKYTPHVVEPAFGLDRTFLAVLLSAYDEEMGDDGEKRIILHLKPHLAPVKVAILPLMKKEELVHIAKPLAENLAKEFAVEYDETQSIGKRYRRQDEIGTPFCVTIDYDSLEDKAVTVRERDSMKQERVSLEKLPEYLKEKIA